MTHNKSNFDKWCLPHAETGMKKPTNDQYQSDLSKARRVLFTTYQKYLEDPQEDVLSLIETLKARISILFGDSITEYVRELASIDEEFPDSYDEHGNEIPDANRPTALRPDPKFWNGRRATTMVSHMIFSGSLQGQNKKLENFPLQYILQDPRSNASVNLVEVYRGAEDRVFYQAAIRMIWNQIKEFILSDAGEFVAHILKNEDAREYAEKEMVKLKNVMMTATEHNISVHPDLGMEYTGDRWGHLDLVFDTGSIEVRICDGFPDVSDLDTVLYPPHVKSLVNSTLSKWKDASPGIFVSIIWKSETEYAEHYLFLSEFNHKKTRATFAHGWGLEWNQTEESGLPGFQENQLAIDNITQQSLTKEAREQRQDKFFPLHPNDLIIDVVNILHRNSDFLAFKKEEEEERYEFMLDWQDDESPDNETSSSDDEHRSQDNDVSSSGDEHKSQDHDVSSSGSENEYTFQDKQTFDQEWPKRIQGFYYEGDNMTFLVFNFDTKFSSI